MWSGPRGGEGEGDLGFDSVLRRRTVDSLYTTVLLRLKGLRLKETFRLRVGGGDGLAFRGFLSITMGSGDELLSRDL